MSNRDTRTVVEATARRLAEEVPSLRKLNVEVAVEVHARHDRQDVRVDPSGPTASKGLVPDARIRVEVRRDVLNELEGGTLDDFVDAWHVGRVKATGVPQYLQLVGGVIAKAHARQRRRPGGARD